MAVSIKTNVNYTTYGHELWKIHSLAEQTDVDGTTYVPLSTSGNVSWTSNTSGVTYDTSGESDPNIVNKGTSGLLYWLNSLFLLSTGSGGYGDCLIDQTYLAAIVAAIRDSELNYAEDAGVNDTYVIALEVAPTSYSNGLQINFLAATQNTGACTLNANSLGAKSIKDVNGADPATGMIAAGQIVSVIYDGTNFVIQSVCPLMNTTGSTLTTPVIASFYQDAAKTKLMTTPDTTSDTLATLAAVQTFTNKTHTSPLFQGLIDGWILANETWTYVSATTFTVSGDQTGKYAKGNPLKWTQNSTNRQSNIAADPTYSAGTGLTTVTIHAGYITSASDCAILNTATYPITANYYAKTPTPHGFIEWFNYVPTVTAQTGSITSYTVTASKMRCGGKVIDIVGDITITNKGTGADNCKISIPITASAAFMGGGVGKEIVLTGEMLNLVLVDIVYIWISVYNGTTAIATNARFVYSGQYSI
jgi:hypothetical protein